MLGKDLSQVLRNEKIDFVSLSKEQLNILNAEKVKNLLAEHKPTVVINCAAYTKVDMAEVEKDKAFAVNGVGVYNLAKECKKIGAKLVHISTDYVFNNKMTLFRQFTNVQCHKPLFFSKNSVFFFFNI